MGKCCLHASLFIFDRIIIKVAGNQDRHKSLDKFDFGPDQTTHFGFTCPWMTKILHFRTWISLRPVGQSWSNFMCSITGGGERLPNVLRQIGSKLWCPWLQRAPIDLHWTKVITVHTTFWRLVQKIKFSHWKCLVLYIRKTLAQTLRFISIQKDTYFLHRRNLNKSTLVSKSHIFATI